VPQRRTWPARATSTTTGFRRCDDRCPSERRPRAGSHDQRRSHRAAPPSVLAPRCRADPVGRRRLAAACPCSPTFGPARQVEHHAHVVDRMRGAPDPPERGLFRNTDERDARQRTRPADATRHPAASSIGAASTSGPAGAMHRRQCQHRPPTRRARAVVLATRCRAATATGRVTWAGPPAGWAPTPARRR
jgi:hypothetical protein